MLGLRRETVTIHLQRLVEIGAVRFERGAYRLEIQLLEQIAARHGVPCEGRQARLLHLGEQLSS